MLLETLFETDQGEALPLTGELARMLSPLRFTIPQSRVPYCIGNMVTTLDGVVALNSAGHLSGGEISGFNPYDQAMVGTLRAIADAVIVGAETFRVEATHFFTPEDIAPAFAEDYHDLRVMLGKTDAPLNVIVSSSGDLNLNVPLFQQSKVPALILTTRQGFQQLKKQTWPASLQVEVIQNEHGIAAKAMLEAVSRFSRGKLLLVEGGPRLMSAFLSERCLNELFLTLAPQIAGRDGSVERPGLVKGQLFAPDHPQWSRLVSVKRAGSHLFLRYALET
jgi:riboflavin biosynthesis pyrimidine reductase